ncbi:MAG: homocysteine S-methyltransferase family protein [Sphaerochaetaceae bacterium]|nr:homocysteine S-methyltransferase family protein [Sphaerochaetaceae bacterium]
MGLKAGELPELWNLSHPEAIVKLGRDYYEAGSNAICTNTFGANGLKFTGLNGKPSVEEIVLAAYKCADEARKTAKSPFVRDHKYIALDIGPLGKMLKPLGDLDFEEAVSLFAEVVKAGVKAGVDYVYIETMNDSYETKAAVIAAKENCNLPIFVSNVYDESGKLMTGASPEVMATLLEGLNVDVIGANCSLGPKEMCTLVPRLESCTSVPLLFKPNAGLPREENGKTVYDVGPEEFASYMVEMVNRGARIIGGCCGTTPDYIRAVSIATASLKCCPVAKKNKSVISSYSTVVEFGKTPVLIGERINPTGKKLFKEALRNHDIAYILNEGVSQQDKGVHVLDVNVGLPEIDEPSLLEEVVKELQSVSTLPLQIDTSDPVAMERALRIYNGKAMVNSVNGKEESMKEVFPLVKKYGGYVVCLTLDENGIPDNAQDRFFIASKIAKRASKYGIGIKDLIFDPLAMAVSSDSSSALVTLETIKLIKKNLGACCSLGISNVSFGLPNRDYITSTFFLMALNCGLNCAIMNPFSFEMMKSYYSYLALSNKDESCLKYMDFVQNNSPAILTKGSVITAPKEEGKSPLELAVVKGLKEKAVLECKTLLENTDSLDIINSHIVPALDKVGVAFEKKQLFLPQLLLSAEAAKGAFEAIRKTMKSGSSNGPKVIIATVKGDIHDIGKNIVKVLLQNYNFNVIDLGKDVPPEVIVNKAIEENVMLVGLSALMTTTVPAMAKTIELLKEKKPNCKVVVGGAVLTLEYAKMIGADKYSGNAMETVRYAQEVLL